MNFKKTAQKKDVTTTTANSSNNGHGSPTAPPYSHGRYFSLGLKTEKYLQKKEAIS